MEELDIESKRTKCSVYSRIVGYIRPVKHWNPGKAEEFKDRKLFKIEKNGDDIK